ncbi:hypothetical protein ACGEDE_19670 [Serratia marcescens]|uniref:hypothetical protein n=1 Tax=Serratia marcescens TaxID=615 RepID=UPI002AB49FF8|nr:hypothetical protein [Serratia marcescens]MDY7607964.1 hypothetical protein [Serratia marcescens]
MSFPRFDGGIACRWNKYNQKLIIRQEVLNQNLIMCDSHHRAAFRGCCVMQNRASLLRGFLLPPLLRETTMFTLKIITANRNEIINAIDSIEWKRAEKTIYADACTGELLKLTLQPGDTAYLVNSDNRTVATYTNPAKQ